MGHVKRIWYLSPMRAAKVQASLRICAVSPEPLLLAHTSSESRGTFRQKASSLAPLNGWACAVKICHNGNARRHKFVWRGPNVWLTSHVKAKVNIKCYNTSVAFLWLTERLDKHTDTQRDWLTDKITLKRSWHLHQVVFKYFVHFIKG